MARTPRSLKHGIHNGRQQANHKHQWRLDERCDVPETSLDGGESRGSIGESTEITQFLNILQRVIVVPSYSSVGSFDLIQRLRLQEIALKPLNFFDFNITRVINHFLSVRLREDGIFALITHVWLDGFDVLAGFDDI